MFFSAADRGQMVSDALIRAAAAIPRCSNEFPAFTGEFPAIFQAANKLAKGGCMAVRGTDSWQLGLGCTEDLVVSSVEYQLGLL